MPYQCFDIIKSPLDGKTYLALEFDSGLQCCLISTASPNNDIDYGLPLEPNTCSHQEVYDFNKNYLQMYSDQNDDASNQASILERIFQCKKKTADTTPEAKLEDRELLWEPPCKKSCLRTTSHPPIPSGEDGYGISITVGVGCLNDPRQFSGLAHLLEHSLFLGTKSFSDPWEVLMMNSTLANAATEMDHTLYFATMTTQPEFLTILHLFSEMITNPTLDSEHVSKEVLNVDCENAIKLSRDFLRIGALFLLGSFPEHRMVKFGMGDVMSLGKSNIGQMVKNYHHRYYRPNYTTVCIQAPLPMEDIIQLAANHFGDLQFTNRPSPWDEISLDGFPFDMKRFSRIFHVFPFKNVQWMIISWVMSAISWQNHQTKPLEYVATLLTHKSKTGLDHYLKKQGWITCSSTSFSSECQEQDACYITNRYYSGLHFGMELTNEGVLHEAEILKALFAYIAMLREVGPQRRIFNELRTIRANQYHYKSCMEKHIMDIGPAASKHRDPKFILTAPELLTTYDPVAISYVVDSLHPKQTHVAVVSRTFQNEVTIIDPVSLVTYGASPFGPDFLAELENVRPYKEFGLPEPNPYITYNLCRPFDLIIGGMTVDNLVADLHLSGKAAIQLQHSSSKPGLIDFSTFTFEFTSPFCKANQHNSVMLFLLKKILKEKVSVRIHQAVLAGVSFQIYDGESGILFSLEGPSIHLPTVWQDMLDEFVNFEEYLHEETFLAFKELNLRILQNANLKYDTLGFAEDLVLYLTTQQYNLMSVLENYLRYYVTFEEMLRFATNFKSRMWIYSQLNGTIAHNELNMIASSISNLKYDYLPAEEICVNHLLEIPIGEKCLRVKGMLRSCITSTTWNYYQFGKVSEELEDVLPLFGRHLSNFMFRQLRTKEQLSYFVKVEVDVSFTVAGLSVILITPADRFKPGYIDERIDNAFVSFYHLHIKTDERIRNLFKTLCKAKETCGAHRIPEIVADKYFPTNLRNLYKNYLPYKTHKIPVKATFRKLSVQVQGNPRFPNCIPLEPRSLHLKRKLYEVPATRRNIGSDYRLQGKVVLDFPDDVKHENAYFITNIEKFRNCLRLHSGSND